MPLVYPLAHNIGAWLQLECFHHCRGSIPRLNVVHVRLYIATGGIVADAVPPD